MIQLQDLRFAPYISGDAIHQRIAEMGNVLSAQYAGKQPVFIIVMKGAFMFGAALLEHFTPACTMHFVKVQSYTGTQGGAITSFDGLPEGLQGQDVIIIEDIIDSGNTVAFLLNHLQPLQPASIYTVALLQKDIPREQYPSADLVAFRIPDVFVVGFGLDYNQLGRNLPGIYQLT